MNRMFRSCLLTLALVVPPASVAAPVARDPADHFFHQSFNSLPDEAATARAEGKQGILIMFEHEECPWCIKMRQTVLNQSAVQDYYRKHFRVLAMRVNGDVPMTDFSGQEMPERDFAFKQQRVRATPVFIFFDLNGNVTTRFTGTTTSPEEFLWLGEFVTSGAWKSTNFTVYKRGRLATKL